VNSSTLSPIFLEYLKIFLKMLTVHCVFSANYTHWQFWQTYLPYMQVNPVFSDKNFGRKGWNCMTVYIGDFPLQRKVLLFVETLALISTDVYGKSFSTVTPKDRNLPGRVCTVNTFIVCFSRIFLASSVCISGFQSNLVLYQVFFRFCISKIPWKQCLLHGQLKSGWVGYRGLQMGFKYLS